MKMVRDTIYDALLREWMPGGRIAELNRSNRPAGQPLAEWSSRVLLDANMRVLITDVILEALDQEGYALWCRASEDQVGAW